MEEYLAALEEELRAMVVPPDPVYAPFYGMFAYHLGWVDTAFRPVKVDTGKRVRPLLCLLSAEAVGGDWRTALPIAAAIELAHNFSLVHDDIEDSSDKRRGRAAVWKVWGLPQGLNAGDGMFVLARLALDRLCERGIPVGKCSDISLVFDMATLALTQGQFLDLGFEARLDVTVDEYMQMIRGKTAALISAAARIGAMLNSENPALAAAFAQFGENAGLAFQITDDILGIWGDPVVTGKSAATDIVSRKKSLPALYGLQHSSVLRTLYEQRDAFTPAEVALALELLDGTGARAYAQERADAFRDAALEALGGTRLENRAVTALREITDRMTRRDR